MIEDVIDVLACARCGRDVLVDERTVRCPAGHSFDIAREGYVSMLVGDPHTGTGDTSDMVHARAAFLGAGHYEPLAEAVAGAAARHARSAPGAVVELGAGTGYFLARSLEAIPERVGLALDVSKHALRRAARAHPRIGAVACDVWQPLPVKSRTAGVVLDVFSPRNPTETRRVLQDEGALVVATPGSRHLLELVGPLGLLDVDPDKESRLQAALDPFFMPVRSETCEFTQSLSHDDVANLAGMGPSAHHLDAARIDRAIAVLPQPVAVTASATVATYVPRL